MPIKNNPLLSQRKDFARPKTTAFLCSLATAVAFILPFILLGGGVFYVSNDQITQQLPFTQQIVRNLHSGNFVYDYTLDLGSGLIEGYTWYNLGSVFSLIQYLFPARFTPYLLGPMLILKFAVAGLLSFIWLRRYTRWDVSALIASLCYSFCGMAITNMVFPFQDVYSLFPLLPLAMDLHFEQKYTGFFALAVALNILVNPPLFFGTAVFMGLYFACKALHRQYDLTLCNFFALAAQALIGVALSGFILFPFVASLAANPRVGGILPFGKEWFVYVAYRYFEICRSMVLPPEVMHKNSMFLLFDAVSPEGYLPLFGLIPVFAYVVHKRKDWLSRLLLTSFVFLLVPVLNSSFNAFNATYYTRWFYMPMLFAALAVGLFLEDGSISHKPGLWVWGGFAALLVASIVLWRTLFRYDSFITYFPAFWGNLILAAASLAAVLFCRRLWAKSPRALAALTMVFALLTGAFNLTLNQIEAREAFGPLPQLADKTFRAGETTPLPEGVYRTNSPVANQYFGHSSPFSFNSTVSGGIFALQEAFGRQRTSTSIITYEEVGLWALLGVQYILVDPAQPEVPLPNTVFYREGPVYSLVENLDALPYVLGFDQIIHQPDVQDLGPAQKSIALLHGLVLSPELFDQWKQDLQPIPAEELGGLEYAQGVAQRKAMAASQVTLDKNRITATLTMPTAGAVLLTVPQDGGWQCTINGEKAELVTANWGLMAAQCPAGELDIVFTYRPVGSTAGLWATAAGLLALGLTVWWGQSNKKRRLSA